MKKLFSFIAASALLVSVSISAAALDGVKGGTVFVSSTLNLRQEATTESAVIKKLSSGATISVFGEEGGFYRVQSGDNIGYVSTEYVQLSDILNVEGGGKVKVNVDVLNLRDQPNTEAGVVAKLAKGETAKIVGINTNWLKVESVHGTGYVFPEYVDYIGTEDDGPNEPAAMAAAVPNPSVSSDLISYSKQFLGTRYVYGGSSPKGFDCSGFTSYVFRNFGIGLERTSSGQTANGTKVSRGELAAGDLVFFTTTGSKRVSHVGIYIGNGQFIHAVKPGSPLAIDTMASGYYSSNFWGARRVL